MARRVGGIAHDRVGALTSEPQQIYHALGADDDAGGTGGPAPQQQPGGADDDVIDAEFTRVSGMTQEPATGTDEPPNGCDTRNGPGVAREWLPVQDNLDLALEHAKSDPNAILAGMQAMRDQAIATLAALGFLRQDEVGTASTRPGTRRSERIRDACSAKDLQCIGTSATLASGGTWPKQQVEVAVVASRLFGALVHPHGVIGETLERATTLVDVSNPSAAAALRDRVPGRTAE